MIPNCKQKKDESFYKQGNEIVIKQVSSLGYETKTNQMYTSIIVQKSLNNLSNVLVSCDNVLLHEDIIVRITGTGLYSGDNFIITPINISENTIYVAINFNDNIFQYDTDTNKMLWVEFYNLKVEMI